MDQLKWSKAARGIIISPIIIIFFIIINSSCIFILIIIVMARSWALVARKQVRTELDEVSLTVLHQLRWWAREMRLPRALCSFKSPAWCLQQRGRDTNMDLKKKKNKLWRSLTWATAVIPVRLGDADESPAGFHTDRPPHPLPTPTPSSVSVLFHHQLHSREPKGAGVAHGGREGLRRMGGCDLTRQVSQTRTPDYFARRPMTQSSDVFVCFQHLCVTVTETWPTSTRVSCRSTFICFRLWRRRKLLLSNFDNR